MKTVTYEQFLTFKPCWLETEAGKRRLERYAAKKEQWTALDVLALKRVPAEDRVWAVLREEFVDASILHEFACRCAERTLARIENPDPRSVAAIEAKRKWLRGEITDNELVVARYAAEDAAWAAAQAVAQNAASAAEREWQVSELVKMLEEAKA